MGEMRERMMRGELYIAVDPESKAEFERVQELLARFNGSAPGQWDERDALLKELAEAVNDPRVVKLIQGLGNTAHMRILDARDRPGPQGPEQLRKLMEVGLRNASGQK